MPAANNNLDLYNDAAVVSHYETASGLMPPEQHLVAKYLKPGLELLDIGVGGGRTTAHFAPPAKRYVGVDYSAAMVALCQRRFPGFRFVEADATALDAFKDGEFDVALFSFNGIDCIPTDEGRIAALKEMSRVTKADGLVIMSSHNAKVLGIWPQLDGVGITKKLWRILRSAVVSLRVASLSLTSGAFGKGHGFLLDPVHGGLYIHVSTPESIARDAAAAGLRIVEVVDGFHPKRVPQWLNPWHTYVMRKAA